MRKISEKILLFVVLVTILCPLLWFNFKSNQVSVVENRALAERASVHDHPDVFMQSLDDCINDRIGFRDEMMRLYNNVIYKVLNGHHKKVITGEDGWLFYADDLPDYTGTNIREDTIECQVAILKAIDQWCKERDIIFVFAVGPNKSTVYSRYMPDTIFHEDYAAADRVIERAKAEGILAFYPKEELIAHREDAELYYRLDTHWNAYGSRYLLDELVEALGFAPLAVSTGETKSSTGDLLTMKGVEDPSTQSVYVDVPMNPTATITNQEGNNFVLQSEGTESFVCYRDSFTTAMYGYYSYYFHGPVIWSFGIDPALVEQEAPRYLILSCVERYLGDAIAVNQGFLDLVE